MLIAQLTDLHVRPKGVAAYRVVESNMLTQRALRAVAAQDPAPDAVIITGDLTDCGLVEEYQLLASMLARSLSVPVFAVPGNHDRREVMLAHLPGTRQNEGFVQYAIDDFPVRLVMLDTVVPGHGYGELCPARLAWLDQTLAAAPDKPTLIGMHHPPFACGIAAMDAIMLRNAPDFAALLRRHKQVGQVVCGHHHRVISTVVGGVPTVIGASVAHQSELDFRPAGGDGFVMEPPAFQMIRWTEADGFVAHTVFVEDYPGPFPFLLDPDYPGHTPA